MTNKDWITVIAEKLVQEDNDRVSRAYNDTPKEFQQFIVVLENNEKLFNNEQTLAPHHKDLGLFSYKNATYIKRRSPYMVVDGRVKMAIQACKEADVKFELSRTEFIQIGNQVICQVCYKGVTATGGVSESWGTAELIPTKPNPYRMAETATIGRALGVAGFGVFGNGIESADEMKEFISANDQTQGNNPEHTYQSAPATQNNNQNTQGKQQRNQQSSANNRNANQNSNKGNTEQTANQKNVPVSKKLMVNSPVEEMQDGSYKFKAKTRDSQNKPVEVVVFVPSEAKDILESAIPEEVMAVKGWLDEKRKVFRAAKKQ
ncbi:hypothetical protein [Niallia taxi]|uniref:hypothetical protein n=1 Tax=Niallia taxi TaxID=2499688 RepID=UPI0015F64411|nr:hypothetical protein [Niallia taxi]